MRRRPRKRYLPGDENHRAFSTPNFLPQEAVPDRQVTVVLKMPSIAMWIPAGNPGLPRRGQTRLLDLEGNQAIDTLFLQRR